MLLSLIRMSGCAEWMVACLLLLTAAGCGGKDPGERSLKSATPYYLPENTTGKGRGKDVVSARPPDPPAEITIKSVPRFVESQQSLGIAFVYDNGAAPQRRIVETTGGGAGWLDVDGDNFPDLYLVQGGSPLPADEQSNTSDRLFRNRSGSQFEDVTAAAGIDARRYGQGIAVGDFDGDGFDDIFVTNVGADILYQNQGDGTFRDVTISAGITGTRWGTSAAWADLDQDGDLDLFVCNYLDYDPQSPVECVDRNGQPRICHPAEVSPQINQCYRNDGDGRFTEVLESWGLQGAGSKSLGLVIADLNGDNLPDVYVANDTTANHLFVNQGQGSFAEQARSVGVATDGLGQNQASMGVAFGDYDQDGLPDLYVTHFSQEYNTLYRSVTAGRLMDVTPMTGMMHPTRRYLGFGTVMLDFNSDGLTDILVVNGHIDESFVQAGDPFRMPAQLFSWNGSQWEDVSRKAGDYFRKDRIGRGAAIADIDNDGDADVVIVNQNAPTVLLENIGRDGHWLKVRFIGPAANRRGIGAVVTVTQGDRRLIQQLSAGTSYCASHQPALFPGLGSRNEACTIQVRWPDGKVGMVTDVAVDQEVILHHRDAQ